MMLGNERVVRSGVPLVQMRLRIGPADAIASFERLVALGHIQCKDEWRVIALLSGSSINDASPAFTPPPVVVRPRLSVGSVRAGEPRRHLQVVHPKVGQTTPPNPPTPVHASLDDVIAEVEQRLAHLAGVRDALLRGMAQLEVLVATLQSLREQLAKTEDISEHALRETSAAVAQIMERLRHGGSQ